MTDGTNPTEAWRTRWWDGEARLPMGPAHRGARALAGMDATEAVAALVDNAYQADANGVVVRVERDPLGRATRLSVSDDGHGIPAEALPHALTWGGTHRPDDRTGVGRFGFGLPSALSTFADRWSVTSTVRGGAPHTVEVRIPSADGDYGFVGIPAAVPTGADGPTYGRRSSAGTTVEVPVDHDVRVPHGPELAESLGLLCGVYLPRTRIVVDDDGAVTRVRRIDPLFLTPFTTHADRSPVATPVGSRGFDVTDKETKAVLGRIEVRVGHVPTAHDDGVAEDPRVGLARRTTGIVVSRFGRVVDVVEPTPLQHRGEWPAVAPYPGVRIHVDYTPSLDEEFGYGLRRRVHPTDRIWDRLRGCGLPDLMNEAVLMVLSDGARARNAARSDEPRVAFEVAPDGPAFRVDWGDGRRVVVNEASRFFVEVHSGPESDPTTRAALETLLVTAVESLGIDDEDALERAAFDVDGWARHMETAIEELSRVPSDGPRGPTP